jgi:hypothetical protein
MRGTDGECDTAIIESPIDPLSSNGATGCHEYGHHLHSPTVEIVRTNKASPLGPEEMSRPAKRAHIPVTFAAQIQRR